MTLSITEVGRGQVTQEDDRYHLHLPHIDANNYHNAQVSSYVTRKHLRHWPPLRMSLRAWAEGTLHGTAGFGFWNHPYDPTMRHVSKLRLPRAVWFFHASPPNHMPLAQNVPGHGWKCATFDAANWRFLALLPLAIPGFLAMRLPYLYERLWPAGQRALGVNEHLLPASTIYEPHDYWLEWLADCVVFSVDGEVVFIAPSAPQGPLGFVAWVDNQFAIVTPQGRFAYGLRHTTEPQTLHIESLHIEQL